MRIIIETDDQKEVSVHGMDDRSEVAMDAGPPHPELLAGLKAEAQPKRDLKETGEKQDAGSPPEWLEGIIEGGTAAT